MSIELVSTMQSQIWHLSQYVKYEPLTCFHVDDIHARFVVNDYARHIVVVDVHVDDRSMSMTIINLERRLEVVRLILFLQGEVDDNLSNQFICSVVWTHIHSHHNHDHDIESMVLCLVDIGGFRWLDT